MCLFYETLDKQLFRTMFLAGMMWREHKNLMWGWLDDLKSYSALKDQDVGNGSIQDPLSDE